MANKKLPTIEIGIIGDTQTGKTSLIINYAISGFTKDMTPTLGIDFFALEIKSSKNIKYNLKIYDTAGQEQYHSLALNIFKKCKGLILVYSINNEKSFENEKNEWIKNINDTFDISKKPILLVGNKIDLDERIIQEEEGRKIADDNKFLFYETSAKTGENVEKIFQKIFETIINGDNIENDFQKEEEKNNKNKIIKLNNKNTD